ncbi:BSD domain-containing protein 1-A [Frankliniella fusca]|uniref:BSD domain-containing protein 1-A n=1 Tax=Frankliniella fusca TaxID=407009 RepID=A0AAE1H447_9NEOP|nr:BSD domain-containing protein 1-A [Frankliniella fusca]
MADGGGWWGSLSGVVNAAKNKSAEVLEFVKRDLDELSSTVKNEASQVVNSTTSVLKEQLSFDQPESTVNTMKRSMSSFLGTVNNVLNPAPDDSDQEAMVMRGNVPVVLSRFQAQLHTLMTSEETFTAEPSNLEAAQFSAWLEIQEDLLNSDNLKKLMVNHAELHAQYVKLVPSKVSHADFWQRFLFRRALLEDEEAHREAQERRLHREAQEAEHYLRNQEDDLSSNKLDISDEEQIRLLQEYENEFKTKSSDEEAKVDGQKSTSPLKLPLKENHYSDGKSPESGNVQALSDEESETSLILDAKNKLFSFVKTAIDSLDLLENDNETEESSVSSYEKCPKNGEVIENEEVDMSSNLEITVKEKGDMVVLGKSKDRDENDTGTEDCTPISSSSSSSATLPDDEWEKLQAGED